MEYKNISIEGPNGVIRTSSAGVPDTGTPEGTMYAGCFKDVGSDRVLDSQYRNSNMTPQVSREERRKQICSGRGSVRYRFSSVQHLYRYARA